MKRVRDEIDHYMSLWQEAEKQFPKEKKTPQKKSPSFFGMHNLPESDIITEEESKGWNKLYQRSLEIDPDDFNGEGDEEILSEEEIHQQQLAGLMDIHEAREAKKKAAESRNKKVGKKPKKKAKPVEDEDDFGGDKNDGFGKKMSKKLGDTSFMPNPVHFASVGDDSKLRVTPNFTDGPELRALAKMKTLLHDLESELLGTDVRGGNAEPIRVKMIAVRRQCEALSQRLIPDPKTDVS